MDAAWRWSSLSRRAIHLAQTEHTTQPDADGSATRLGIAPTAAPLDAR